MLLALATWLLHMSGCLVYLLVQSSRELSTCIHHVGRHAGVYSCPGAQYLVQLHTNYAIVLLPSAPRFSGINNMHSMHIQQHQHVQQSKKEKPTCREMKQPSLPGTSSQQLPYIACVAQSGCFSNILLLGC